MATPTTWRAVPLLLLLLAVAPPARALECARGMGVFRADVLALLEKALPGERFTAGE